MKKQVYFEKWNDKYTEDLRNGVFDGWVVEIFVEDEQCRDKWYTMRAGMEKDMAEQFDEICKLYPSEKIRLKAPAYLAHTIWKSQN